MNARKKVPGMKMQLKETREKRVIFDVCKTGSSMPKASLVLKKGSERQAQNSKIDQV